jgi:hypothetical protein
MDEQSHRGRGLDGERTAAAAAGGGSSASVADRVLAEQQQALQAMEGMSLASPFRRGAPSAASAAAASSGATDLASWNDSPAMLQRELVAARMRSAQARAREIEIQQRLQALSPSAGALPSPSYLHPAGGLAEGSPLYATQLVGQNQALAYPQTASRSLPLARELEQLRAARGQAMMGGMFPSLQGTTTQMLSSAIPPPPLTGGESMGSLSARGHAAGSHTGSVVQLSMQPEDFGLQAATLYQASGPASIHSTNLLAAQQERADLLRRMQQQQQMQQQQPMTMMHAGQVLHPVYATASPRFHGSAALLAAREQQLQQFMMQQQQQQRGAQLLPVGSVAVGFPSAAWIQTNESNVADASSSPSRSLRVVHTGLVGPAALDSGMMRAGGLVASPGGGAAGDDKTAYQVRGTFINEITELDVLCGRGGRSNHWPGNKRYRRVISEMKNAYKSSEGRKSKTGLSRSIVDHVLGYGGRFVREEEESGRYYVLTKAEARVKTSQALREGKDLKWTG